MLFDCLECHQNFETERSLHAHLKIHKIDVASYYCKHFPRRDLLTGNPIQFKDKGMYFRSLFANRENMIEWLKKSSPEIKKPILEKLLDDRIKEKELKFAPCEVDLFTSGLPPISEYKQAFKSYSWVAEKFGIKPMFSSPLPKEWDLDFSNKKILIDTREQHPLEFKNQEKLKLDIGDYAVGGEDFCYIFVDRKAESDFRSTLSGENFERFQREIQRCKDQSSYLFVVVEASLEELERNNKKSSHPINLAYIFHNMRELQNKFPTNLQFVFSGGRKESQRIIPKLLCLGQKLKNTDIQYFLKEGK